MKHILLIEPDKVLRDNYTLLLKNSGYDVATASNAQDAINSCDKNKPDVVVLELQLIEHSGLEFLYEFRSYPEWQSVPVIIYTIVPIIEFSSNFDLMKKELNIFSYLYKPAVSVSGLIKEVKKALKNDR